VARHARAGRAEVTIRLEAGQLYLIVSDDGRGFHPAAISEAEELGLAGMRERASLIGGALSIESAPGRGTRVHLRVRLYNRPEPEHI
jgi:signal transduction histidine kinase